MLITEINGANLAYLGDAVMELLVRKKLVLAGGKLGDINKIADSYVRAGKQSEAADKLADVLTEEENAVYKRGRNVHVNSIPKNATEKQYKKATGLEALFGYLYLKGENERIEELFEIGFFENSDF